VTVSERLVWRATYGEPGGIEATLEFPYTEGEFWSPPGTVTLERMAPIRALFELALIEHSLVSSSSSQSNKERE